MALLSLPSVQINWITRATLLWVQIDWLRDRTTWMDSMVDRLALSLRRAHQVRWILNILPVPHLVQSPDLPSQAICNWCMLC